MTKEKKIKFNPKLTRPNKKYYYGTAGYRLNTPDLINVICRASIIACLRSITFNSKLIGIYITASHNPLDFNGISFIDYNGGVLEKEWEKHSDELVNCKDSEFKAILKKIYRQNSNYTDLSQSKYKRKCINWKRYQRLWFRTL